VAVAANAGAALVYSARVMDAFDDNPAEQLAAFLFLYRLGGAPSKDDVLRTRQPWRAKERLAPLPAICPRP